MRSCITRIGASFKGTDIYCTAVASKASKAVDARLRLAVHSAAEAAVHVHALV